MFDCCAYFKSYGTICNLIKGIAKDFATGFSVMNRKALNKKIRVDLVFTNNFDPEIYKIQ